MGVSENSGFSPKSSILIGISIINHPFWGTTIFGNTHIYECTPGQSLWPFLGWLSDPFKWLLVTSNDRGYKGHESNRLACCCYTGIWVYDTMIVYARDYMVIWLYGNMMKGVPSFKLLLVCMYCVGVSLNQMKNGRVWKFHFVMEHPMVLQEYPL